LNSIPFTKLHGCGNDFIAIDNREQAFSISDLIAQTPAMCNRKLGIGADGLLVLNTPVKPNTDFEMIYRNADGSDAGMCGNGGRCIAQFANSLGMGKNFRFSVHKGLYSTIVNPTEVQLSWEGLKVSVRKKHLAQEIITLFQLFTGTDHVVLLDQDLSNSAALLQVGAAIRYNKALNSKGTNVNFIAKSSENGLSKSTLNVITYERGVEDLTLACGTGALASAIAWHFAHKSTQLLNTTMIKMPGGKLLCEFRFNLETKEYDNLCLSGAAITVYNGVYYA
jgi:diaminopimelate epimerase